MEMNEAEQRKMNFWTLYLVFYAALFLFAMIGGGVPFETMGIQQHSIFATIALFPTMLIYFFGTKTVALIKSIPRYVLILAVLKVGLYFVFGERTYADCILNHTKDIGSDRAASAIMQACRKKYLN
ncbi:hypothetical protein LBMAG43_15390 [Methylococcaceae bacterium]|nr:hypothetical protein LBMAG43_15390 [Methylococcaceae bacterium]